MDTPFKWVKQVASHFGGTAQGMAISWPGHIGDEGGIRRQFHHMIDIAPTILEATGIPAPDMIDGVKQQPMEDVSLAYTFDKANAAAPTRLGMLVGLAFRAWAFRLASPPKVPTVQRKEPSGDN